MQIMMTGSISGSRDGKLWPAYGDVTTVPDDEGAALCASGLAVPVDTRAAAVENATQPETAVTKRRR